MDLECRESLDKSLEKFSFLDGNLETLAHLRMDLECRESLDNFLEKCSFLDGVLERVDLML